MQGQHTKRFAAVLIKMTFSFSYIICVAAQKDIEQVKYNSLVFW